MYKKTMFTDEEFVKLWQKAQSAREVAKALDTTVGSVCARAYRLRQRKVKVKKMLPGFTKRPVRVKELNQLIEHIS